MDSRVSPFSLTSGLWSLVKRYSLDEDIREYLLGGSLVSKASWKQFVKAKVHTDQEMKWRQGLELKQCHRFLRIHPALKPSLIYCVMKLYPDNRNSLVNMIKIIAYPEEPRTQNCYICGWCNSEFRDAVEHYIMSCQYLVEERMELYDVILDTRTCAEEARILQLDDTNILDIILSGNTEMNDYDLMKSSAKCLMSLMCIV